MGEPVVVMTAYAERNQTHEYKVLRDNTPRGDSYYVTLDGETIGEHLRFQTASALVLCDAVSRGWSWHRGRTP